MTTLNDSLDRATQQYNDVHVMPRFGPEHICGWWCWCYPEVINQTEVLTGEHNAFVFQHNVFH